MCEDIIVQLTVRTVLIIFRLIFQTIIIAQMMSGEGDISHRLWNFISAILVVQVEQSVRCVCARVRLRVRTVTCELSYLWPRYLTRWFIMTLSRSNSKVKVIDQSSVSVLWWSVRPRVRALRWRFSCRHSRDARVEPVKNVLVVFEFWYFSGSRPVVWVSECA